MNTLEKIKDITWPEVFEIWRAIEEPLEHWKNTWKEKGFDSWEAWRKATHKNLQGEKLSWALYKVKNPSREIPNWRGGMFHAWSKWFYPTFSEQPPRLRDLLSHPGVNNHWYVREIARNFPKETTVSATRLPNGEIIVVEGMHRCCAVAWAAHNGLPLDTHMTVALADWPFGEAPRLGTGWLLP